LDSAIAKGLGAGTCDTARNRSIGDARKAKDLAGAALFGRDCRRHAVAELRRVGPYPPARVTGIFAKCIGPIANGGSAKEVPERWGDTSRDACPLDEGAVKTENGRSQCVAVVRGGDTHRNIGARRTEGGLLTGIRGDVSASAHEPFICGSVIQV